MTTPTLTPATPEEIRRIVASQEARAKRQKEQIMELLRTCRNSITAEAQSQISRLATEWDMATRAFPNGRFPPNLRLYLEGLEEESTGWAHASDEALAIIEDAIADFIQSELAG